MMGNRGALHNGAREIVRPFKVRALDHFLLEFKGGRRSVTSAHTGRYELFLDEAVAFAAGQALRRVPPRTVQ